jgi:peptidoglycan/LPS O-acetylase OafA/YrhL
MKFESINFFRGIAVLMVVFIHTYNFLDFGHPEYPAAFLKYVEWGQFGVQFFFILSALTLCNSFEYSLQKQEKNLIRNFYIKRFFRIYPMFFLMMLVFLVYSSIPFSAVYKALNFVFLNNYYPPLGNRGIVSFSWTLNVEMSFYVLFPFIYFYFYKKDWLLLLPTAFDALYKGIKKLATTYPDIAEHTFKIRPEDLYPFTYRHLMGQISVFLLGFILYKVLFSTDKKFVFRTNLFIGILLAANALYEFQSFNLVISYGFYFLIYFGFKYVYNYPVLAQIKRIGVCSYSIYLLHYFGIQTVIALELGHLTGHRVLDCCIRFIIVVLLTWGASEISLRVIENPFINLGKKLLRK